MVASTRLRETLSDPGIANPASTVPTGSRIDCEMGEVSRRRRTRPILQPPRAAEETKPSRRRGSRGAPHTAAARHSRFELFDLDPKASFKITGEQIDGAFTFEGIDYLLEARWQRDQVDPAALDVFDGKIRRKLENTLGLFVAINGFSDTAVGNHSRTRPTMILMDGADLWAVLEGRLPLPDVLRRKRRHAAQTGEILLHVSAF